MKTTIKDFELVSKYTSDEIISKELVIHWDIEIVRRSSDVIFNIIVQKAELELLLSIETSILTGDGYNTPVEYEHDVYEETHTITNGDWKVDIDPASFLMEGNMLTPQSAYVNIEKKIIFFN